MTGILIRSPTGCSIWHDSGKKKPAHAAPQHKHLTSHSCSLASEESSSKNSLMFDIINPATKDYGPSLNTVVLSSHRIHHLLVY